MQTQPNTPEREAEVDKLLLCIRSRLIAGDFANIEMELGVKAEAASDGFTRNEHTGSFALRAEHK